MLGALQSFAGRLSPPPPAPGKAIAAGSPWLLPLRLSAGTGLMERIQAIAQNVSDIAVKVDQILRHSLLLHSKGGGRGRLATPRRTEYRVVGCPAWGPISPCSSSPGSWGGPASGCQWGDPTIPGWPLRSSDVGSIMLGSPLKKSGVHSDVCLRSAHPENWSLTIQASSSLA